MIGGLTVFTVTTLFLIPVLYSLLGRFGVPGGDDEDEDEDEDQGASELVASRSESVHV